MNRREALRLIVAGGMAGLVAGGAVVVLTPAPEADDDSPDVLREDLKRLWHSLSEEKKLAFYAYVHLLVGQGEKVAHFPPDTLDAARELLAKHYALEASNA